MHGLKRLIAALAVAALPASAEAAVFDIAATDTVGVEVALTEGKTYHLTWIGIADGGAYDAAGGITLPNNGGTGFSNAFVVRDSEFGSQEYSINIFSKLAVYGTAADSLNAYKAGGITNIEVDFFNNAVANVELFPAPFPFIFTAEETETLRLLVFDFGSRDDNTGGVSLNISEVPEPASWAMLIVGFGLIGSAMRRREVRFTKAA